MRTTTLARMVAWMALAGCGGEGAPASPIVADEPASPPPEAARVEDARDDAREEDPPEPEPRPRVTFALSDAPLPSLPRLPARLAHSRGAAWHVIRHPDPVARRRLEQLVEALAYGAGRVYWNYEPASDDSTEGTAGCRVQLATERVVSYVCRSIEWDRSGSPVSSADPVVAHFAIHGSEVRPFALREALRDGASFGGLIDERMCVAAVRRRNSYYSPPAARALCRRRMPFADAVLVPGGVDVIVDPYVVVHRPFASVREALRDDGPIAWLFAEVDAPPPPSAEDAGGWALGEIAPPGELVTRWLALPAALRAHVALADRGSGARQLVVARERGLAEARAAAQALDVALVRTRWEAAPVRLVAARLTRDADLGGARGGHVVRALPAGTRVVALASGPELGVSSDWVEVVVAPRVTGWVTADALVADEACVPSADAVVGGFDEADREEAAERAIVATVTLGGEPPRPATLIVTRAGASTRVRLETRDEACGPAERIFEQRVAGAFFDVRLVTTEPEGGERLVVLGVLRGSRREYVAHHVPSGRQVLSAALEEASRAGTELGSVRRLVVAHDPTQAGRCPLSIEYECYRWNGRQLVVTE
ncbi:MAG: hypothetical protein KF729_33480 [Sandaracinaceae bacterium]|nr:hypothetical protein [Sandaracinaceae bacterium]